jgi:hypothetical protein
MPTMTASAGLGSGEKVGEGACIRPLYGARTGAEGYISICRICDSCMLVCQTSSKKFK